MSATSSTAEEKRIFHRWKIDSEVSIACNGENSIALCKDLSGAGMLIEAEQAFSVGDEMTVSIEKKDETHLPFNAIAEVSRIEDGAAGKFIIGLSIKEIID
jgi:hypothetical protein